MKFPKYDGNGIDYSKVNEMIQTHSAALRNATPRDIPTGKQLTEIINLQNEIILNQNEIIKQSEKNSVESRWFSIVSIAVAIISLAVAIFK